MYESRVGGGGFFGTETDLLHKKRAGLSPRLVVMSKQRVVS